MKTPTLSIIIPTYNSARTIQASLNSVLEQSFEDFEIIIQDGLSNDDTVSIVERIKDQSPAISIDIVKEQDQGVYDAMNKALVKAKGEWVFFLGSDDTLHSNTILEEVFAQENLDRYNVMYGNVDIVGDNTWAKNGDIYDGEFDFNKLLNRNICHQCIFYRRAFTDQVGFYNIEYILCADWDYNLRCWAKTKFFYFDKIVSDFQAGGETTKANRDEKFEKDFLNNLLTYFNLSIYDPVINNSNFRYYYQVKQLQKPAFAIMLEKIKRRVSAFISK